MDKDEALKLALEALEANFATWSAKTKAIPIIKEALAQPEQESDDLTIAYMSGCHDGKNTPHPKPDQEPVTLQINSIPPFKNPPNDVIDAAFHVSNWAQRNNWTKWRIGKCCSVDYTTPPQRKPLTDEQLIAAYESEQQGRYGDHIRSLRAIEAAHGIKGKA